MMGKDSPEENSSGECGRGRLRAIILPDAPDPDDDWTPDTPLGEERPDETASQ